MSRIWKWLKSFFTRENVGAIWSLIFGATKSALANTLQDKELQAAALSVVRQLADRSLTNEAKRASFAELFGTAAKRLGYELKESAINLFREGAVNALKVEQEGCCGD